MATIQIREIPEDAYETIRKRARTQGQSIQAYMRAAVIEFAARPTPTEILTELESVRGTGGTPGATPDSILEALSQDRR